jgi:predicted CopG family antitoxin
VSENTSIEVTKQTWKDLNARKDPGDTFNDVIRELLQDCEAIQA